MRSMNLEQIKIREFGPIKKCDIEIRDFTILIGEQSSGKSTVAKSIFLFQEIKANLQKQLSWRAACSEAAWLPAKQMFIEGVKKCLLEVFGEKMIYANTDLYMEYNYAKDVSVKIYLETSLELNRQILVEISDRLAELLELCDQEQIRSDTQEIKEKTDHLFTDNVESIYIPSERGIVTLLGNQLVQCKQQLPINQKEIGGCLSRFIDQVSVMRTYFSDHKIARSTEGNLVRSAKPINEVLHGEYQNKDGEETIRINDDQYVPIAYASSGQKEALWILNTIRYCFENHKKMYLIIEEPESYLFPEEQKLLTECISMVRNSGSKVLLMTHSPYVLGTLNNLLYASKLSEKIGKEQIEKIIDSEKWIKGEEFVSYHIKDGIANQCIDADSGQIQNEQIDTASDEINEEYNRMILLKVGSEE